MQNGEAKRPPWPTTEDELADFWAHRVFNKALAIMAASIALGVLVLGAAVWLLIKEAERRVESQVQSDIKVKVDERIETEVNPLLEQYRQTLDEELAATRAELTELRRQVAADREAVLDYLRSRQQLDAAPAELPPDAVLSATCQPGALDDEQRALLAVSQRVSPAGRESNGRPLFNNRFRLAVAGSAPPDPTAAPLECLTAAVDRVVYSLNPRWFDPARNVRTDPASRFAYEVLVWGTTPVEIEIFLINQQGRICLKTSLRAQAQPETALAPIDCDELRYALDEGG